MRVGFHVGQVVFRGADLRRQYEEHLEQFRTARDAGFDYFSWGHHWLIDPFQHFQPIPMLARLAAERGDMELMTMLLLTPLLNPVAVAEDVATLDHICEGGFIFGAGLGYRPEECEAAGITMEERAARFIEGLDLMKRLWTEEDVTFRGRFYRVTNAKPTARCYQRPHPRVWVAGMTDGAVRRAARIGHAFIPSGQQSLPQVRRQVEMWREKMTEAGHALPADQPLFRELYVAATHEEAVRRAARSIEAKYGAYREHGFPGTSGQLDRGLDELMSDTFIVGDPEECAERLAEYATLGFTHVGLRIFWPAMEPREVLEMTELAGKKILPAVQTLRRENGNR